MYIVTHMCIYIYMFNLCLLMCAAATFPTPIYHTLAGQIQRLHLSAEIFKCCFRHALQEFLQQKEIKFSEDRLKTVMKEAVLLVC